MLKVNIQSFTESSYVRYFKIYSLSYIFEKGDTFFAGDLTAKFSLQCSKISTQHILTLFFFTIAYFSCSFSHYTYTTLPISRLTHISNMHVDILLQSIILKRDLPLSLTTIMNIQFGSPRVREHVARKKLLKLLFLN